jgi:hypothetical protein
MQLLSSTQPIEVTQVMNAMKARPFIGPRRGLIALSLAVLLLGNFLAGCVHVAPYERGMLAHPTMTVDDVSTAMDEHVRAVSEGAAGGLSGGGGGCGCN